MAFLGTLIGAVIGVIVGRDIPWLLAGAVLGYLVAEVGRLKSRIAAFGRDLESRTLERRRAPSAESVSMPAAPVPATEPAMTEPEPGPDVQESAPTASAAQAPAAAPEFASGSNAIDRAIESIVQHVRNFFTGGNTLVRVGVIILFFGVAFLLKFAAENAKLPVELRLAGVALSAIVLLILGVRLRPRREAYGLTLEGGAIGVLYLVVFAALRLYDLVPAPLAFGLLLAICALSAALALLQNSHALAVLGAAGGFLAPVLASTGQGSHVMLFSYYAVLNLGILAIAWFKAWRLLNLVGFGFTFVIGAIWGYRFYQPEFFATTEPFLIFFFLLFVAVTLLFARRQPPALRDPVDGTLVFGVPIVGFLLQAALVESYEYGVAWSALALAAFYLGLAAIVLRRNGPRLLAEAFVALGTIFATLTIPLAVDGYWTAAAWAIEGAGVLWIGLRQSRLLARAFGLLVQLGAGVFFALELAREAGTPMLNAQYIGSLLLSLAGVVSAYLVFRQRVRVHAAERVIGTLMLAWGLAWWYGGNLQEIRRYVEFEHGASTAVLVLALTTWVQEFAGRRLDWFALRFAVAANLVLLFLALGWATASLVHPFAGFGFIAWAAAFGVLYATLKTHDAVARFDVVRTARHAAGLWLAVLLLMREIGWALYQWLPQSDWPQAGVGVWLALMLAAPCLAQKRWWPVRGNERAYLLIGALLTVALALWWILTQALLESGNSMPLPYVPLLSPLDLAALALLAALWTCIAAARRVGTWPAPPFRIGLGAVTFAWLNAVLFRALHHFGDIPYTLEAMLHSVAAQTAVSIFWTTLAFALMLIATRVRLRLLWLIGSGLLGVVVVKLFMIDLSNTGSVARIVSFVGVGLLLLLIGYLVPVPPKTMNDSEAQS